MSRHDTVILDRGSVLRALRPGTAQEQGWTREAQDLVRERIVASDQRSLAPLAAPGARVAGASTAGLRQARAGRRRRTVTLAVAGALLAAAGGGAAAAAGRLPAAFTDAFASWGTWSANGVDGADPDTAHRVATAPGPDGTVFSVVAAPTKDARGVCVVAVYETKDSARQPGPSDFQDVSSDWCAPSTPDQPFGAGGVDVAYAADVYHVGVTQDTYVWSAAAGGAVRAHVLTADGRAWPAVSYDGTFFGWFPAVQDGQARPVLIGYAADGSEVGRTSM